MLNNTEFDFIVVGAGTAGCVLADRLSASGQHTVLLLEAGGEEAADWIHEPPGHAHVANPESSWLFKSMPEERTGRRQIAHLSGKVLGGTSSINGMEYLRGQREDYDGWRALGNVGWGYSDVLPYFRKAEDNQRWSNELHGTGGPICVSDAAHTHPVCEAFFDAAGTCGYARNQDLNGAAQAGFGYSQVMQRNGARCSTAIGYLRPARRRTNLVVLTNALATRILLAGRRATGVDYRCDDGRQSVYARSEVILAGGALNSPRLLQLSGIGPGARLQSAGISVKADIPGVGANLQDHYYVRLVFEGSEAFNRNGGARNPLRRVVERFRSESARGGTLAATGFIAAQKDGSRPDVQIELDKLGESVNSFPGFTLITRLLQPESRGTLLVTSPDPRSDPEIRPNYLASARDRDVLVAGLKAAQRIAAAAPLLAYVARAREPEHAPTSDREWLDHVREHGGASFHAAGTCRMGNEADAVVDERLRVRGVERLRVVDASIMPALVSGDTTAATIMIGEKGADMILHDIPQPAEVTP